MGLISNGWFDQTLEQRRARERRYDFLLELHGGNGEKARALAEAPRLDGGYFGPDSISWKVYENVLVAGMGALSGLFISVLDPDGGYRVGEHSTYYYDALGRVRRSLLFFGGAVFGDSVTADKVGRDLFRKHAQVNGVLPATGEEFRANHVETLKFTYVVGWQHLWRAYAEKNIMAFTGPAQEPTDFLTPATRCGDTPTAHCARPKQRDGFRSPTIRA